MTTIQKQRKFARYYKLPMNTVREIWEKYSRRPQDYQVLIGIDSNAKTVKGQKKGYLTGIIYLAPGKSSGVMDVCTSASEACLLACLAYEGRSRLFATIQEARIRKTRFLAANREAFIASMLHDVFRLLWQACRRRLVPCFRPNGTSDLPYLGWITADAFPFLQVYDYTKHARPHTRVRSNYHLTYSYSGSNWANCLEALRNGVNVTVVFNGRLPETWQGYKVINGDETDLRFTDKSGVIVGLKAKGKSASKETSHTFILNPDNPFFVLAA